MPTSIVLKSVHQSVSNLNLPATVQKTKKTLCKGHSKIKEYVSKEWNGEKTVEKTKGWIRNWFLSYNPLHVHDNHKKEINGLTAKRNRLHCIGLGLIKKLDNSENILKPEAKKNIKNRLVLIRKSIKQIDKKLELINKEVQCQNFQYLGKWSNMLLPGSGLAFNILGMVGKFKNAYTHELSKAETTARIKSLKVQAFQMVALTGLMFGIKVAKSAVWDASE